MDKRSLILEGLADKKAARPSLTRVEYDKLVKKFQTAMKKHEKSEDVDRGFDKITPNEPYEIEMRQVNDLFRIADIRLSFYKMDFPSVRKYTADFIKKAKLETYGDVWIKIVNYFEDDDNDEGEFLTAEIQVQFPARVDK